MNCVGSESKKERFYSITVNSRISQGHTHVILLSVFYESCHGLCTSQSFSFPTIATTTITVISSPFPRRFLFSDHVVSERRYGGAGVGSGPDSSLTPEETLGPLIEEKTGGGSGMEIKVPTEDSESQSPPPLVYSVSTVRTLPP